MTDVELRDIDFSPEGPSDGWCATLVVSGTVLGAVEAAPDDGPVLVSLAPGAAPDDVRLARDAVALDDPEAGMAALAVRCAELAAREWIRRVLVGLLAHDAVGVVEGPDEPALRRVARTASGTLAGAIAHLTASEPDALILNGMPMHEAMDAYVRVAACAANGAADRDGTAG